MILFELGKRSREALRKQPETGMGFQLVESATVLQSRNVWLALAGEYAVRLDDDVETERWLRMRTAYEPLRFWFRGSKLEQVEFHDVQVLMQRTTVARGPHLAGIAHGAAPARSALVKKATTRSGDRFYRFSASSKDGRIEDESGDFPGTYATSARDWLMAPSGFAAVGRYALPNVQPASYVYEIVPRPDTEIHVGTVAPGYGQAGGGVEVYFPSGAANVPPRAIVQRFPDE